MSVLNTFGLAGCAGGVQNEQPILRIKRDGSLDAIRVEIPSGNATVDQSALLAVKRSDPLPRLPDGFEGQTLGVRFWFTYLSN